MRTTVNWQPGIEHWAKGTSCGLGNDNETLAHVYSCGFPGYLLAVTPLMLMVASGPKGEHKDGTPNTVIAPFLELEPIAPPPIVLTLERHKDIIPPCSTEASEKD